MRILITGGAGCLGSNLLEHWLPKGHQILIIDNFATGKREVLSEIPKLIIREGSIANDYFVNECFASFEPEIVVHSAAAYKDPNDWIEDSNTNVIGSANIAKAAKAHGVERLINFQTALCYGRPRQLPIPNTHPTAPFTSYGITKTAGEHFMLLSGVPTLSLRIANVTGPRLAIGPIPSFFKRLKAGQDCFCSDTSRDFVDMSDFLSFMDLAIRSDAPTGIFNVSSGEDHSIKEIFDLVVDYLGLGLINVPIIPPTKDDIPRVSLDASETLLAFGWATKTSFTETIRRQLQWYEQHGITDIFSHLKIPSTK